MLTTELFIAIISLCITCFNLGYTVGSKSKNKHQKTAMFGKLWRSFGQTYIRF